MKGYEGKWRGCIESDWNWKQDPNDLFVLIIVLYGVNILCLYYCVRTRCALK